jgi:hypothetical protein
MQLWLEGEQKLTQIIRFSNALARAGLRLNSDKLNPLKYLTPTSFKSIGKQSARSTFLAVSRVLGLACALVEAGFEYVCGFNDARILKRKH